MRHLPLLLAALMASGPAWAEDRGIVIDNGRYEHAPALTDSDASAAVTALKNAGFRTVTGKDLISGDLRQAVADLLRPDDKPGARLMVLNGRFLHSTSESWFMGADADKPDLLGAGSQGVALSMIMDLMRSANPGAVVMLGTDDQPMEHAAGLESGLGDLSPPEGVTVVTGPPAAISAAANALMQPGTSLGQVLKSDDRLTLSEGGDTGLVLVQNLATDTASNDGGKPGEADRDLWAKSAALDTAEAYQAYLAAYPNGLYSAAASERLAKLGIATKSDRDLWAQSAATNTEAAYRDYLAQYPSGEFAEAAQRRLLEFRLAAEAAKPAPQPVPQPAPQPIQKAQKPVQQPIQTPANPGQVAESNLGLSRNDRAVVQRRLNALGYSTGGTDGVFGSRSRSAIRGWQQQNGLAVTGYLTGNQLALLRDQAGEIAPSRDQQDQDYWQRTGARGGVQNLRAYLNRYPNGLYAQTARNRLAQINGGSAATQNSEDRAWERARDADTVRAYDNYLENWPRGEHSKQARQRRERLIRQGQGGNLGNLGNLGNGGDLGLDAESIIRQLIK